MLSFCSCLQGFCFILAMLVWFCIGFASLLEGNSGDNCKLRRSTPKAINAKFNNNNNKNNDNNNDNDNDNDNQHDNDNDNDNDSWS